MGIKHNNIIICSCFFSIREYPKILVVQFSVTTVRPFLRAFLVCFSIEGLRCGVPGMGCGLFFPDESKVERVSFWDVNSFTLSQQLGMRVDFSRSDEPDHRVEVNG